MQQKKCIHAIHAIKFLFLRFTEVLCTGRLPEQCQHTAPKPDQKNLMARQNMTPVSSLQLTGTQALDADSMRVRQRPSQGLILL
jgi:hypothetical protein